MDSPFDAPPEAPAVLVRAVALGLAALGKAPPQLRAVLPAEGPGAPERVSGDRLHGCFTAAAMGLGTQSFAAEVGFAVPPGALGLLDPLIEASGSLDEALAAAARYFDALADRPRLEREPAPTPWLRIVVAPRAEEDAILEEFLCGVLVGHLARRSGGSVPLAALWLRSGGFGPAARARHAEIFGVRPIYEAALTSIVFAPEATRPWPAPHPARRAFTERVAAGLNPKARWAPAVHAEVRRHLTEGRLPDRKQVAAALGLAATAMDRHLAAEGLRFPGVVDLEVGVLAERRLLASKAPASEVAAALGFADEDAFSRVFRRTHLLRPEPWRARVHKPG